MGVKRPPQSPEGPSSPLPAPGEPLKVPTLENLWDFLSSCVYEDGSPREPGSMSIFTQDGKVKCCLKDKTAVKMGFLSGPSFVQLLLSVEKALGAGTVDWRPDKGALGLKKGQR